MPVGYPAGGSCSGLNTLLSPGVLRLSFVAASLQSLTILIHPGPQIPTWAVGDAEWPNAAAGEIWMVFQMPPDCAVVISNWETSPLLELPDQKLLLPLGCANYF